MPNFVDVGLSTRIDASPPDPDQPNKLPDDAYPAIIEDQRHAYGCDTYEDVLAWQAAWLAGECPPHATPRPPMVAVRDDRTVVPHINASRWIAECADESCGAANAVWDRNPDMVCLACGRVYKVAWQLPAVRSAVIRVMADWPTMNRSWDAHKGETVEELKLQAILMQGVAPDLRNGLVVAAGIDMPDDLTSPGEYLDRLRTRRIKAAR
jgi:hypothetical protein